ncbi:hypothetical protein CR513_23596, partial [Mucuna pruriens]
MTELNRNSKFKPFSRITELLGMKYYSSKDFVFFRIYKSSLQQGSGKTTLAKEVGKKGEELKLFKKVVAATVSQCNNKKDVLCLVASLEFKSGLQFKNLSLWDVGVEGVFQFKIGELGNDRELVPLNLDLSNLKLWNLLELKFIRKGPTNFLSLQLLCIIEVFSCPKLKTIFSPTIDRSLLVLKYLHIYNCEELEQIFDSSDAYELKSLYSCSQQVCFPKLNLIRIQSCNKLKCLFYNFMAGHFPSLTYLEIKECFQLEEVFNFEHEANNDDQEGTDKDGEQEPLENLKDIRLSSLPNFKEIHHKFKLKDHVERYIKDCPKYAPNLHPDM